MSAYVGGWSDLFAAVVLCVLCCRVMYTDVSYLVVFALGDRCLWLEKRVVYVAKRRCITTSLGLQATCIYMRSIASSSKVFKV
ncbi:hypothetical protein ACMFMG_001421 [Clarireedia jacksonii]